MGNSNYQIYFALHYSERLHEIKQPAIIFCPSSDNWNDFSLKTRFTYEVVGDPNQRISGDVHLAFLEAEKSEESPSERVGTALRKSKNHLLAAKEFPGFYTMHLNMEAYREIVRKCGPELAEEILLAMNDLVAVKRTGRLPNWFKQATLSRQFILAFTRSAETFFAFHNAGSILGGLEQESLRGISTRLRLEFQLPAFSNPHALEFSFEYESELPKRIAVVIGKNGVGKSQTLSHFAKSLLFDDRRLTDVNGERPSINRLLAISSPGETRNTFPSPRKSSRIDYRRVFLTRNPAGDRQSGLGDVLVRIARSEETIREKRRWMLFCDTVSTIAPLEELVIKLHEPNGAVMPGSWSEQTFSLADMRNGGEQQRLERWGNVDARADVFRSVNGEVFPLSSGQLTFIRFAAQACLHIENGTMVLCDEPETHLHPNYISDFVRLLDKLLAETGSFAILATHSAYFVREVARSQVIVLRQTENKKVEVLTPRLRTFGADIGEISHFVFEDELFGNLVRQVRHQLKSNPSQAAKYLNSLERELSVEAWMSLSREVPRKEEK